jgi:hypothetical protein
MTPNPRIFPRREHLPPPRRRVPSAAIALGIAAAACCAFTYHAFAMASASSMTLEQAIEAIEAGDEDAQRSAIVAASYKIEAFLRLLHQAKTKGGPLQVYAVEAADRIREQAGGR